MTFTPINGRRQTHRRNDRGAQEQERADYLGRVAGNSWHSGHQRHELSRRALSRARRDVDEDGDYAVQGPDFEGQTRRLRTADGVHFTKAGAVKIASYVDRELRRVMPSSVAPVALPGPETTPKSESAGARPDVGPVLPLTASGSDRSGDLLGAGDHSTQTTSDPVAAKVLGRGGTLAAPAGRADDFSWPRPRKRCDCET